MPRRLPILIVALALVAALGFMWRSLSGPVSVVDERSMVQLDHEAVEMTAEEAPEQLAVAPEPEAAAEESQREVVAPKPVSAEPAFALPSDVHWFDGRVIFPPKLPMDESFEVEARGRRFGKGKGAPRKHTVQAGQDGRFRIAFSKKTKKGWVALRGRYMYLNSNVKVDVKKQEGEIVLEPLLGGALRGVVAPPPGTEASAELFEDVTVRLSRWDGKNSFNANEKVTAEGSFEFLGLAPSSEYGLRLTSRRYAGEEGRSVSVLAGELTEVDLQLTLGAHIAGRVVAADGEPIEGATVLLKTWRERGNSTFTNTSEQETKQDGSFEFSGEQPGRITLTVRTEGAPEVVDELGELEDGDRRDDRLYTMTSGLSVNGIVSWQDGEPAAKATIVARPISTAGTVQWDSREYSAKADAQGRFELTGLDQRKLVIDASARRVVEGPVSKLKGKRRKKRGPRLKARVEDVEPGTHGIRLVLGVGEVLRGSVRYASGEPVGDFWVEASPEWNDRGALTWSDQVERKFDSEDGEFELAGLKPGSWQVTARGKGFAETGRQMITVPFEGRLDFEVLRAASIKGVVKTPSGEPLAGAKVVAVKLTTSGSSRAREQDTTNGRGEFTFDAIEPGNYRLIATSESWAPSQLLELSLAPEEERANLVLNMPPPCRVTGVVSPNVGEVANRRVTVHGGEFQAMKTVTSDERGEFEFQGLGPGDYRATLQPESHDEQQSAHFPITAKFTVVAGGTTHFELGAGPKKPIRIHGVVTSAGSTASDYVLKVSGGESESHASARTDGRGAYSLLVDGPGRYSVRISPKAKSTGMNSLSFRIEVAGGDEQREDFELPSSTISLTLLRPDGTPASETPVSIALLRPEQTPESKASSFQRADSEGHFEFRHLVAGNHRVRVGGSRGWWQEDDAHAVQYIEVQVSQGATEKRTIRLEEGATLHGKATLVDGTAASGLSITVIDGHGREVPSFFPRTDSAGRFKLKGLPAGELTVRVEAGGLSGEARVRLATGGEADISIVVGS